MSVSSYSYPPGPRGLQLIRLLWTHRKNPLWFLVALGNGYGDIVHFRLGRRHAFFVKHPDAIREVLVTRGSHFRKGLGHQWAKRFLGEGLLTSEGEFNCRQRRLMQPAFHRERLNAYGLDMVTLADRLCRQWRNGAIVDVDTSMHQLTLAIVSKTLFGAEVSKEAQEIGAALTSIVELFRRFYLSTLPLASLIQRLPLPSNLRFRESMARLDAAVAQIIQGRRLNPGDRGDLLSMLLAAQEQNADGTTQGMTGKQLRDEVMTLLLTGHDSTANVLTWTWYLISKHPEVEARLHEELSSVLNGGLPSPDDITKLHYTHAVFSEVLRLFPVAFGLGRQAIADTCIGGVHIPKGSVVIVSPYVTHRDMRFFDNPEGFVPERWTTEAKSSRPDFAYFPFGGGMRRCIGEQFAWLEAMLIIASIARRWRLLLVPGHPIEPEGLVTLRPKDGMPMRTENRTTTLASS